MREKWFLLLRDMCVCVLYVMCIHMHIHIYTHEHMHNVPRNCIETMGRGIAKGSNEYSSGK